MIPAERIVIWVKPRVAGKLPLWYVWLELFIIANQHLEFQSCVWYNSVVSYFGVIYFMLYKSCIYFVFCPLVGGSVVPVCKRGAALKGIIPKME
jgi:hypothetical protein